MPTNRLHYTSRLRVKYGDNCHMCGLPMVFGGEEYDMSATKDHIISNHAGGPKTLKNLRLAHRLCNMARGKLEHWMRICGNQNSCLPISNTFRTYLRNQIQGIKEPISATVGQDIILSYPSKRWRRARGRTVTPNSKVKTVKECSGAIRLGTVVSIDQDFITVDVAGYQKYENGILYPESRRLTADMYGVACVEYPVAE